MHRTVASELDTTPEIPLGVSLRALSRVSGIRFGGRKNRREAPGFTSSPHQKHSRSSFARAPSRSQFGESFLRQLRLDLVVTRLGSPESWLRQPFFEAHGNIFSGADNSPPPYDCPWAHIERVRVLARESHGVFFLPRGSFCLVKVNGRETVTERPGVAQPVFGHAQWGSL